MRLFNYHCAVLLLTAVCTAETTLYFVVNMTYGSMALCYCTEPGRIPTIISVTPAASGSSCQAAYSATCTESPSGSSLYSSTYCTYDSSTSSSNSNSLINWYLPTAFGSMAYVALERYATGLGCTLASLINKNVYIADAKCYKSSLTSSYRATAIVGGGATLKTYTDSTCSTSGVTVLNKTRSFEGCDTHSIGTPDMKFWSSRATPKYLSSMVIYGTNIGDCALPAVPTQLLSSVVAVDTCVPTTSCSGVVAPYNRTSCSSSLIYQADVAAVFGSSAYVFVQTYTTGTSCSAEALSGITTYLADGKCHQTGLLTSFRVSRVYGTMTVKTYIDSGACSTNGTTLSTYDYSPGWSYCYDESGYGFADIKIFGGGLSPFYLTWTVTYDSKISDCKPPAVPTRLVTVAIQNVDVCTPTTICIGTVVPYTGTLCSAYATYQSDMAAIFGMNPYVIVEKYPSNLVCRANKFSAITIYLADGKCHKISELTSYRATRATNGSVSILTYYDTTCIQSGTPLTATAAEATGNSCANDRNGISDTKIYGGGVTPAYLSLVVMFDTNTSSCKLPIVPTQIVASVVPVDTCNATTTCNGTAAPYTITSCSSSLTYQADVATMFSSSPFVIVSKYTAGQNCDVQKLSNITAYLADGKCHKTSTATSWTATRAADGSATIETYANSLTCNTTAVTLSVTATQANGNSCTSNVDGIPNTMVFGNGTTPAYVSSIVRYDTSAGGCKSPVVPIQLVTTTASADGCTASSVCSGGVMPYSATTCGSMLTYLADVTAAFGTSPYVIVQKYIPGSNCDATRLSDSTAYLADGKCHKTDATASYAATRATDASATIKTYSDSDTCGTTGTTLTVTAAQATANLCLSGTFDVKLYGDGVSSMMCSSVGVDPECRSPSHMVIIYSLTCSLTDCGLSGKCSMSRECCWRKTFEERGELSRARG